MKKQQIDEDTFQTFEELKQAFKVIEMQTRQAIREHITGMDQDFKRSARKQYLKDRITDLILEAWELIEKYLDYDRRERTLERLDTGDRLLKTVRAIQKMQAEVVFLKKGNKAKQTGITPDMIARAKQYPFNSLVDVNRHNMALCPFHGDKAASFSVKNNFGYCFSCQWKGDTITFLMQRDGLNFQQAVRQLQ